LIKIDELSNIYYENKFVFKQHYAALLQGNLDRKGMHEWKRKIIIRVLKSRSIHKVVCANVDTKGRMRQRGSNVDPGSIESWIKQTTNQISINKIRHDIEGAILFSSVSLTILQISSSEVTLIRDQVLINVDAYGPMLSNRANALRG